MTATDTVTLAQSASDITYAALGEAAATHYVFNATLEAQSQASATKVGFILSWADTSSVDNAYAMAISRSQNEINFYKGGTELTGLARTYFNGAKQTSGSATVRTNGGRTGAYFISEAASSAAVTP